MSKPDKSKKSKDPLNEPKEEGINSKSLLDSFLKTHKDDHYNFEDPIDYKVSSGSLLMDYFTDGGLNPGLHRFVGINEGGKEQPVSEPVLTPNGWVKIGDLRAGDKIIDSKGEEQTVYDVFPQGEKDVYEVEFDDGCKVRCGIDHLWETSTVKERNENTKNRRSSVRNLKYIIDTLIYGVVKNHAVRIVAPIKLKEKKLPIEPYMLGLLIGDGGLTCNAKFTNADDQIWKSLKEIVSINYPTLRVTENEGLTNCIVTVPGQRNPLLADLRIVGLLGLKSHEKFIPEEYKFGSIEQRLSLLQGLIDTDGFLCKKKSTIVYYTTSEKLSEDVLDLIRSLGGIARRNFKMGSYLDINKKRVHCKKCWIISFHLPPGLEPCRLERKLDRHKPRVENFLHFIKSVKLVGKEQSVCIKVSSLDALYVTKDYVLTHNTASSLQFLKNFLDKPKSRKGLYVKAEGRLSKEMKERTGVKFVTNASEWEDGTCYIYESNIYESVVELMRDLVGNNPEKINYFFILDSVDGLMRRGDKDKTFEESAKVAGGAVIAADFMKRVSISLAKRGHIAIFISQVRADIKLDPYSKVPIRQTTATGGNALLHFANWIFEFEGRFKGDQILLDDKKPYNEQENPFLGHFCKITVKKSPNEKTNCIIKYPIRYGRKNGTSNWIEKEILDFLLMWELAVKKGAWIVFDEELLSLLKESGIENFPAQIQGVAKFESLVNGDVKLKTFFFNYISKSFLNFSTGVEIANVD